MNKFARTVSSTEDGDAEGPSDKIMEGADVGITVGNKEFLVVVGDDVVSVIPVELVGERLAFPAPDFSSALLLLPLPHLPSIQETETATATTITPTTTITATRIIHIKRWTGGGVLFVCGVGFSSPSTIVGFSGRATSSTYSIASASSSTGAAIASTIGSSPPALNSVVSNSLSFTISPVASDDGFSELTIAVADVTGCG